VRCPESLEPEFQAEAVERRWMRETIGWNKQFRRRRPVEKSVLTRDETESSNRARAGC